MTLLSNIKINLVTLWNIVFPKPKSIEQQEKDIEKMKQDDQVNRRWK